jgi:putative glutamine amidotransferase
VLSGGQDVHPHHYGEEPSQRLEEVCPQRDIYEIELIRCSCALNKPLLGICRGLQLMNVAFGGSLYQDIPHAMPDALQHSQNANPDVATQTIELVEGTILQKLIGQPLLLANSFHHQAIKQLAPGFRVSARAKDGIIEGIEKEGDFFTLAVQWHPELMFMQHASMQRLFHGFVEAARMQEERI